VVAKTNLGALNCSLAKSLDIVGDWWTLLILRDAFMGSSRFSEFEISLGIAKNILASRLAHLVDAGLLDRLGSTTRPHYELTDKARDLLPAMLALMQWGDRWTSNRKPPMRAINKSGEEIAPLKLRDSGGKLVNPSDVRFVPGPGATTRTREFMTNVATKRASD
jgi:DNA-binding HxlR family transcriptional regulator